MYRSVHVVLNWDHEHVDSVRRAGQQGRRFEIVANDVRVLSQRTHVSIKDIQVVIKTLQQIIAKQDVMYSNLQQERCSFKLSS